MKKLHLHKIFHWLYAILMFLPFIFLVSQLVVNFGTGNSIDYVNIFQNFNFVDLLISDAIGDVFDFLVTEILGLDITTDICVYLFVTLPTYWVCISIMWLVFDVLMYPINLFHKWIDEGGI